MTNICCDGKTSLWIFGSLRISLLPAGAGLWDDPPAITGKKFGALLDEYSILSGDMKTIKPTVEKLAIDVSIVKAAVSIRTDEISVLKSAS